MIFFGQFQAFLLATVNDAKKKLYTKEYTAAHKRTFLLNKQFKIQKHVPLQVNIKPGKCL